MKEEFIAAMLQKQPGSSDPGDSKQKEKSGSRSDYGDSERRLRKIDLPIFNGDDAPGWLRKIELYFQVCKIDEGEKMDAALMAMEGEALYWMQWWVASNDTHTWSNFKDAMLHRFQPMVVTNAFEMLMSMKQDGTVREYRKKFETVSSHIKIQDQELFLGMFSNGLREDIKAEVRLQHPKDLAEMMEVALLAEEKLGAIGRYGSGKQLTWRGYGGFKNWRSENQSKRNTDTVPTSKNSEAGKGGKPNGTKTVGGDEIEERRKKGLCFTCEEKYVPGHVCKNRVLKLLYVEEATWEKEDNEKQEEEEEELVWESTMKSLHSIAWLD